MDCASLNTYIIIHVKLIIVTGTESVLNITL